MRYNVRNPRIVMACFDLEQAQYWRTLLAHEASLEVVGEAKDPLDTLLMVGETRADLVVIDLPPSREDPGLCSHLLAEYPQLKVMAVSSDGDVGVLYRTGTIRRNLLPSSPQVLSRQIYELAQGADLGIVSQEPFVPTTTQDQQQVWTGTDY